MVSTRAGKISSAPPSVAVAFGVGVVDDDTLFGSTLFRSQCDRDSLALFRPSLQTSQIREQRASKEKRLLPFADRRPLVEGVVAHRFDGLEDGQTAAGKHLQVYAKAPIHHSCERLTFDE